MRGKRGGFTFANPRFGITPAYAGKTGTAIPLLAVIKDHPRVCGENYYRELGRARCIGSPPRMRGKHCYYTFHFISMRITPAYAGKTLFQILFHMCYQDHPRVCGENATANPSAVGLLGSPPRMRGKHMEVF